MNPSSLPKPAPGAVPRDINNADSVVSPAEVLPASSDYRLRSDSGEDLLDRSAPRAEDPYADYDPAADPIAADLLALHRAAREAPENDTPQASHARHTTSKKGRGRGNLRSKHARKAAQPSQDWKLVILQQAYDLIVREGKSVLQASRELNCRHSLLVYYARKNRWLAARVQYEALDDESRHGEDLLTQAEATRALLLEKVKQCKIRMDLLEQAVQRKLAIVTSDTEVVTFTAADGKARMMPVPKASTEALREVLALHGDFMKQIHYLSKLSELRLHAELNRTRRAQRAMRGRRSTRETELLAVHPLVDASPSGGDDSLVPAPVDDGGAPDVFTGEAEDE